MRLAFLPPLTVIALTLACPATPATDAGTGTPDAGKATTATTTPDAGKPATPPAPPPEPPQPEPAGIKASSKKPPAEPKGKGVWHVDPKSTEVSFTILSNSSGLITGHFKDGACSGAFDAKTKKGVFSVDLTKMVTTGKGNAENPMRDANVIESFFGARPFASTPANAANAAKKPDVEKAWKDPALTGKIPDGVTTASLVVESVEGAAAGAIKEGASADGTVNGKLVLWDSIEVPVTFPVTATRAKGELTVKGTAPSKFDIEKVVGTPIRKALFENMIAAGCTHQPGIQNEITVSLDQVTLKQATK